MKVIVAKYSGFCPGVVQAEEAIFSPNQNRRRGEIYILGHLIHNQTYIDHLSAQGIKTVKDPSEVPEGSLLVVRTHGIDRFVEESLKKRFALLDLTCPKVKRVQREILSYAKKGYNIVITGKKEHPEVQGLISYARECTVIETESQIPGAITQFLGRQNILFLIISQTTGDSSLFESTIQSFRTEGDGRGWVVESHDSICSITGLREKEAVKNLEQVDATFVVGDKLSSNATKLYNTLCSKSAHTYFISTLEDLKALSIDFAHLSLVQVVSSSSTPAFVEKQIVAFLEAQ